jgi:UDP-3-O-[3-hydroxymyristoyl] glucosamine N-acyltransferase
VALSLGDIVRALGGRLHGDPHLPLTGLAPLETASESELSFLSNPRYQPQLAASRAACVIVAPALLEVALTRGAAIETDDPTCTSHA